MTTTTAPISAPPAAALDAVARQARLLGAEGSIAISSAPLDTSIRDGFVASALRDGVGRPEEAAEALAEAFGDRLPVLLVAYIGCLAGADLEELAAEIEAVSEVAAAAVLVEADRPAPEGANLGWMAERLAGSRAARHVSSHGLGVRTVALRRSATALAAPPLRVTISDHQGKSAAIAAALLANGHQIVDDPANADVVLIDHDAPFHGKLPLVERCVAAGGRAFLYPHGADPANMTSWDGLYPVSPLLSGSLVLASGHAEIARRYGYPYPVEVVGWPFCELLPRRCRAVRRVLFAPSHPPYLGNPRYPGRNEEAFRRLLRAPVQLTVRHVGSLEENGLWEEPGVTFVAGDMRDSPGQLAQIDAADAVVADRSTFGNLAVARGVTAVLWDSAVVNNNDNSRQPLHLDRYRDFLRYPFDADDGDMWDLLRAASRDTDRVGEWRERFIGGPLDTGALVTALRGA